MTLLLLLRPWRGNAGNRKRALAEAEYQRIAEAKRKRKKFTVPPPAPSRPEALTPLKITKAQAATINEVAQLLTADYKPRSRKDTRKQQLARAIDIVTTEILDDSGLIIALVLIDDD